MTLEFSTKLKLFQVIFPLFNDQVWSTGEQIRVQILLNSNFDSEFDLEFLIWHIQSNSELISLELEIRPV